MPAPQNMPKSSLNLHMCDCRDQVLLFGGLTPFSVNSRMMRSTKKLYLSDFDLFEHLPGLQNSLNLFGG